jgi:hypothetical protein
MNDAKITQRINHIKKIMEKNEEVIKGNKVLLLETQKMLRAKVEELNALSKNKTETKSASKIKRAEPKKTEPVKEADSMPASAPAQTPAQTGRRIVRRVQRTER